MPNKNIVPIDSVPDDSVSKKEKGSPIVSLDQAPDDNFSQQNDGTLSKVGNFAKEVGGATRDTGIELMRGFQEGGANMLDSADAVARLLAKFVGDPSASSGTFKQAADQVRVSTDKYLPETNLPSGFKKAYNFIGEVPAMAAEFALARKALTSSMNPFERSFGKLKAPNELTDAAAIGVQSAIHEFKNSPEYASLGKGFAQGSTLGLAFGAIPKAVELGSKLGKGAAYNFIKAVTGDEATARAFVENPLKFNTNPFSKTKSISHVTEENKLKLEELKQVHDDIIFDARIKISEKKQDLARTIDEKYNSIKESNRQILKSVNDKSKIDIENVARKASEDHASTVDAIKAGLHDDFTNTAAKLQLIRKTSGEQVGQAVDNIVTKDIFSKIDAEGYLNRFKKVADDNGFEVHFNIKEVPVGPGDLMNSAPSKIPGKPVIVPKFGQGSSDDAVREILQSNLDDIMSVAGKDGIPLGFAQGKKQLLQQSGYAGEGLVANVQKQLSGALNPAKMTDLIKGKNISEELAMLNKVNKEFSDLVPRYEEALKNYTKLDASGKPIADFERAVKAVQRNDVVAIRQMRKADSALPPEDQLLPKIQEAVGKLKQADTVQLSNVRLAKRKAKDALDQITTNIREKEAKLRVTNKTSRQAESRKLQEELNRLRTTERTKLQETADRLNREETFLKQQDSLRSFFGKGRAGNLQTVSVLGLGGSMATQVHNPNPIAALTGVMSAAGTLIPSPVVGSNTLKALRTIIGGPAKAASGFVSSAQKIASKI